MKMMTLKARRGAFNTFDIVTVDDERWIVITEQMEPSYISTYTLEPLKDFVARVHTVDKDGAKITIADYLRKLEDEFIVNRGGQP